MEYRFASERPDYSDLASGRVFYSIAGHPAFPIRLGSEIFQRCLALHQATAPGAPLVLYDPCCGAGYLAATLAYLHAEALSEVITSDVDEKAAGVARRNLGLLQPAGLAQRRAELAALLQQYGKPSHQQALASAQVLHARVEALAAGRPLPTRVFTANALDPQALRGNLPPASVDLILTDVPYGEHSQWAGSPAAAGAGPLAALQAALRSLLAPGGLLALITDKQQKAPRADWRRLDHFQVGKRRVEILGV